MAKQHSVGGRGRGGPKEIVAEPVADLIDAVEDDVIVAAVDAPDAGQPIVVAMAEDAKPERLDAALAKRVDGVSRSRIKVLIEAGQVSVNGAVVTDASRAVGPGAELALVMPDIVAAAPQPEAIPLTVLHEDADLIVIDKPAGLVVHPGAGNWTGTLVNALIHHCGASLSGIGGVSRPGIVHRLDKDTSGVMVVAKTDRAHQGLADQFADHGRTGPLERAYLALVWGAPRIRSGTITTLIGRSSKNREQMAVVKSGGKEAITHYQVLAVYGTKADSANTTLSATGAGEPVASLIECRLETGRTHQIRVHMAALGHPLLGDSDYGAHFQTKAVKLGKRDEAAAAALKSLDRQALHARLLAFEHPRSHKTMRFESPLPADLARLVAALEHLPPER